MLPLGFMSTLLLFLSGSFTGHDNQRSIECPLPGNPVQPTEDDCSQYSACEWSDGVCHMKGNREAGYVHTADTQDTGRGFAGLIKKADDSVTMFGADIKELKYDVIYHEDYHVQIRITDPSSARYEVPVPTHLPTEAGTSPLYQVAQGKKGEPLVIDVTRTDGGSELLRQVGPITYEDQFLQVSFRLSSPYLYGFGENAHTSLLHSFEDRKTYPLFSRDQAIRSVGEANYYGVFPYYVNMEDDSGVTHSVLLLNSNAMEYSTFQMSDGTPAVTLRTIGGIIDLHVFAGPTPEDVNKQYNALMGQPALPPYWALGFHLSRYGYNSTEGVREVRDRMRAAGIPQDVQTFDIDYMDERHDFSYDPVHFYDMPELIGELKAENIRTTVILDPAIGIETDGDTPYTRGSAADAFVKWMSPDLVPDSQPADQKDFMVGRVWPPENAVFPDFFLPAAKQWWADEISEFHKKIPFDMLWIDMNEPSNFGTNTEPDLMCPDNALDSPPYPTLTTVLDTNFSGRLSDKTLCMSAAHSDGITNYTHYDVHSLYGYTELVATYEASLAIAPEKRPAVLSRSTFPGAGVYAIHWLGDNAATFEQMKMSIIGIIELNMFGIPMTGADICGFNREPTMELCARWMQLGAFYPFSRNHNTRQAADQDPAAWPEVAVISADVLTMRYRYLPYLYTLFHGAHMDGASVFRPMFNLFPADLRARTVDDQFFWGDFLMVAPVLVEGAVDRTVYFPEGLWYGLYSETLEAVGPLEVLVDAPLEVIPLYVRGGAMLPFQEPALTTDVSRLNDFGLLVVLDSHERAAGEVYWDQGDVKHVMNETFLATVVFQRHELSMTIKFDPTAAAGLNLATIKCLGFPEEPESISYNGDDVTSFEYDAERQHLQVTLNKPLNEEFTMIFDY